ncbi:MAG: phosphoglucomutase/phosphomannomutase family protein, partial [Clostridia bacterium]|nr:phosphoglucomutase/phosphomannomutase family protein [Clostridia bacterium]
SLLVEMISKTGKPLSRLIEELYSRYGACAGMERDFALTEEDRERIHQLLMVEKKLPDFNRSISRVSYEDGCKVYFDGGPWVIARFSGTEPRIRVFSEAENAEEAARLADLMQAFIGI